MMPFARIRFFTLAVTLLLLVSLVPTIAQKLGPDGAPNPTASVVDHSRSAHSRCASKLW